MSTASRQPIALGESSSPSLGALDEEIPLERVLFPVKAPLAGHWGELA